MFLSYHEYALNRTRSEPRQRTEVPSAGTQGHRRAGPIGTRTEWGRKRDSRSEVPNKGHHKRGVAGRVLGWGERGWQGSDRAGWERSCAQVPCGSVTNTWAADTSLTKRRWCDEVGKWRERKQWCSGGESQPSLAPLREIKHTHFKTAA